MLEQANNTSSKPANYYDSIREDMLQYIPKDASKVLELGCAKGYFSELVKNKTGAECWGIEIQPEVAQVAAKKLDKVITGEASQCIREVPDGYFDCIICNDVLEHLADPYTLLAEAKKKLTAGGVVVASIPNVRYCKNLFELVVRGNWDYKDEGILDRTHLRFFTYNSLVKTFKRLGYELVTIEGMESEHNIKTKVLRVFTLLTFNIFDDIRYDHFACVARPS